MQFILKIVLDTVAMVILALRCIVQDHRHRNLHHFVRKPSLRLARQQRQDGSFGDLHTTTLVMQALEETENEPTDNWNKTAALAWLSTHQKPDGSFDGDIRATAEAVLGVSPRGLATIRALDCGQGLTDSTPPRLTTNGIHIIRLKDPFFQTCYESILFYLNILKVVRSRKLDLKQKWTILLSRIAILLLKG